MLDEYARRTGIFLNKNEGKQTVRNSRCIALGIEDMII